MTGTKHDGDKPNLSMIYPPFVEGLARVLMEGEATYGRLNWQGLELTRIVAAIQRHCNDFLMGKDLDEKSGEHQAYHIAAGAMFLSWFGNNPWRANDERRWGKNHLGEAAQSMDSISALQGYVVNWADQKLGERSYDNAFNKLDEEIQELKDAGVDGRSDEMADVFIMLLDMANMAGIDISRAVHNKLTINWARNWELVGGVYSHIEPAGVVMDVDTAEGTVQIEVGSATAAVMIAEEEIDGGFVQVGATEKGDSMPEIEAVAEQGEIKRESFFPVGTKVKWAYTGDAEYTVKRVDFNPMTGRYDLTFFNEVSTVNAEERELRHVE